VARTHQHCFGTVWYALWHTHLSIVLGAIQHLRLACRAASPWQVWWHLHNDTQRSGLNQLCFDHCSPCFHTVPYCTAVPRFILYRTVLLCLHPAAAPTTGHLAGAGESRSHGTPFIKYEYGDDRRGVSPSGSFREGASSEGKGPANNLLPRNRRPESWAPWEDVKLGNYRPIQVGRGCVWGLKLGFGVGLLVGGQRSRPRGEGGG
jgi:hypothetical protein